MSEPLGVLFLVLFVIAGAACIYLSITISGRVQAGIDRWRGQERQALETELRSFADADARLRFEQWKQAHEQSIRLDAVQRSLAVNKGKLTEHIVPYLPGFDLDPKDIRFLGTPIDLIAFDWSECLGRSRDCVYRGQNGAIRSLAARKGGQEGRRGEKGILACHQS